MEKSRLKVILNMRKMKKFISVWVAFMLICIMGAATVFAAGNTTPSALTVGADTANSKINLTKYLVLDKDAAVPTETFSFELAPETVADGVATDAGIPVYTGAAVTSGTATVSFNADSSTTAGAVNDGITNNADKKYASASATVSLAGASFTKPGAYRYSIAETTSATASTTVDAAKYIADVYVGYADGADDLSILQVLITKEGSTDKVGADGVSFVNEFTSYSLTITKQVAGNMGDRTKSFDFTLNVSAGTELTAGTTLKAVKTKQDGTTESVTITIGSNSAFTLKHGEQIVVLGLSSGTKYKVTETTGDYTAVITSSAKNIGYVTENGAVTNTVGTGDMTEAFVNTLTKTVDTGINLDIIPYAVIVLLAVACAVVFFVVKRKK